MNTTNQLIKNIAVEQGYNLFDLPEFHITDDLYINLSLSTKDHFEYFIFIEFEFEQLELINNTVQIALFTKLEAQLKKINEGRQEQFTISHYFEKNTTLVISTQIPVDAIKDSVYKKVSLIEEDSFYFKKHVIYHTNPELELFNKASTGGAISSYCSSVASDIARYELYIAGLDDQYEFIVRLYEKLPFLNLSVTEQKPLNLDEMINKSLTDEELELLPSLLSLKDEEHIDKWIDSQGVTND